MLPMLHVTFTNVFLYITNQPKPNPVYKMITRGGAYHILTRWILIAETTICQIGSFAVHEHDIICIRHVCVVEITIQRVFLSCRSSPQKQNGDGIPNTQRRPLFVNTNLTTLGLLVDNGSLTSHICSRVVH